MPFMVFFDLVFFQKIRNFWLFFGVFRPVLTIFIAKILLTRMFPHFGKTPRVVCLVVGKHKFNVK